MSHPCQNLILSDFSILAYLMDIKLCHCGYHLYSMIADEYYIIHIFIGFCFFFCELPVQAFSVSSGFFLNHFRDYVFWILTCGTYLLLFGGISFILWMLSFDE